MAFYIWSYKIIIKKIYHFLFCKGWSKWCNKYFNFNQQINLRTFLFVNKNNSKQNIKVNTVDLWFISLSFIVTNDILLLKGTGRNNMTIGKYKLFWTFLDKQYVFIALESLTSASITVAICTTDTLIRFLWNLRLTISLPVIYSLALARSLLPLDFWDIVCNSWASGSHYEYAGESWNFQDRWDVTICI